MLIKDFLVELKALDPRLDIIENPNCPGLSNIKLEGKDICPIPSEEIREESDANYSYTFPNGHMARHNSRADVLQKVNHILEYIKTEEGKEVLFD